MYSRTRAVQPATPADGKQRCEHGWVYTETGIDDPRIVIDVGEDLFFLIEGADDFLFQGFSGVDQVLYVGLTAEAAEFGQGPEDPGTGVVGFVNPMAETGDFFLFLKRFIYPGLDILRLADLTQSMQHPLVGTAMQRAVQGGDAEPTEK